MPELPEVETIRKGLEKYLIGHKIERVEIRYGKKFEGDEKKLIGGKVIAIRRFGKVQSIDLSNGYSIVIHIKLTGQLIYRGPNLKDPGKLSQKVLGGLEGKHTHVIFYLDRGGKLYFNDVRKFGWIYIVETKSVGKHKFIKKLGPEPLTNLTLEKFKEILKSSTQAVKTLLMNQNKISGVGNIYANDALWLAKINPKKTARKLKEKETEDLYYSIIEVLRKGLKYGGASELSYVTAEGEEGGYQSHTLVYDREGEVCSRCKKAKIKKIFLSGRGTYFCPICQK